MSTSVNSASSTSSSSSSTTTNKAIDSLDTSAFIKMLVAELQNQDPMNPMSNSEMLQQVSQIRSIQSNDKLSTTLESVQLGQNLATAGYMMGLTIEGLGDSGDTVTGLVKAVGIEDGQPLLYVGDDTVRLENVSAIVPYASTDSGTSDTTDDSSGS